MIPSVHLIQHVLFCVRIDNFVAHFIGTDIYLRPYNDASSRLQRMPQSQCQQSLQTSSTGNVIHRLSLVGSNSGTSRVKLFIKDDVTGEKFYLRVDGFFHVVTLECQSALDNVSSLAISLITDYHEM